ncbi:transposase [Pelagicoccus mobilis]|uniref:Transposase n=1 Tax=Pelagicoccus mobilis TaxID=415221 RepID=A0A934RVM3_9BACT|nr:transposase [Pelagicoccus mobilis]MBK1875641.1 transposase [Pelagicoccus mobilis]
MSDLRITEQRWRNRLPHWEVKGASFFITIRCAGSMPKEAVARVKEIRESMDRVESVSDQLVHLQRQLFLICEKYLDSGYGFCPFSDDLLARRFIEIFEDWLAEANWCPSAFCVMPNHVHLLAMRREKSPVGLRDFVSRLKGRSAKELNELLGRRGAFWHPDWFDRWMRNFAELRRVEEYILDNPVKAGLVNRAEDYPFVWRAADAG